MALVLNNLPDVFDIYLTTEEVDLAKEQFDRAAFQIVYARWLVANSDGFTAGELCL